MVEVISKLFDVNVIQWSEFACKPLASDNAVLIGHTTKRQSGVANRRDARQIICAHRVGSMREAQAFSKVVKVASYKLVNDKKCCTIHVNYILVHGAARVKIDRLGVVSKLFVLSLNVHHLLTSVILLSKEPRRQSTRGLPVVIYVSCSSLMSLHRATNLSLYPVSSSISFFFSTSNAIFRSWINLGL